jgi:hypothetical protein
MHKLKMRNTVIHIPTKSDSDKIQGLIVVLVFHQLSSGCILKYCGDEHTNQQCRNDTLEVTNAVEKEWDQLDTRLAKYGKNSE